MVEAGAEERIALYTGNDDHIVLDLVTPFVVRRGDADVTVRIRGGLLGHWSVWTRRAVELLQRVRTADEQGAAISTMLRTELNLDVDMRRAFASVVIGHPRFVTAHDLLNDQSIDQALRTYNAHINRVDVLTYEQLVSTARRSLTFAGDVDG